MQAAQAHCTFSFDPNGSAVSDFYCVNGAERFAFTAARTVILYGERFCSAHIFIVLIKRITEGELTEIVISDDFLFYAFYDYADTFVSFLIYSADFFFVGNIVYGSPGIGHSDRISSVDAKAFFFKQIIKHFCCAARKAAERNAGKNIIVT